MMMEASEFPSRMNGTPPHRKFGTDLTLSTVGNLLSPPLHSTHKKKVRLRKINNKHRSDFFKQAVTSSSKESTSDLEYTVIFQPGPIGLKLEPVVVSGTREVGCRVMKFIDGGSADPGQARASGKIRPGDLLMAIDGTDVISWNYPDVIAFLKRRPTASGRTMTFRTVLEHTFNAPRNDVIITHDQDKGTQPQTYAGFISPSEAAFSHVIASFCQPDQSSPSQQQPAQGNKEQNANFISPEDLSIFSMEESCIGANISVMTAPQSFIMENHQANAMFSPSKVKKLSSSVQFNENSTSPPHKPISKVLSTVYRSVAPAAGLVATSSYNVTSSLTSAMSTKLGEALVGHSSREFDQAIQLKMQLLTELSHAKVTIDAKEEEHTRLRQTIQQLSAAKEQATKLLEQELASQKDLAEQQLRYKHAELTALSQEHTTEKQFLQSEIDIVIGRLNFYEARATNLNEQLDSIRLARDEDGRTANIKEEEMTSQIRDVMGQVDQLKKKNSLLTNELSRKEQELESIKRERIEQQSLLAAAESEGMAKEATISSLSNEVKSLVLKLNATNNELDENSLHHKSVESILETKQRELEVAHTQMDHLNLKYEKLDDEQKSTHGMLETSRRENENLMMLVESLRSSLSQRDGEVAELRTQLDASNFEAIESKQQLVSIHAELQCAIMDMNASRNDSSKEIEELMLDLQRCRAEHEQSMESAARLRTELNVTTSEAQSSISTLRTEFETALKILQASIESGQCAITEKTMELDLVSRELDEVQSVAKDSQEHLVRVQLELQSAVSTIKDMETTRNDMHAEIQDLQTDLCNARAALEVAEKSGQRLSDDCNALTSESLMALASQRCVFEVEVNQRQVTIEGLIAEKQQLVGELDKMKLELSQGISGIDDLTALLSEVERESKLNIKSSSDSYEKEIRRMLDELSETHARCLELMADLASKETELLNYKENFMGKVNEEKELLARIDELQAVYTSTLDEKGKLHEKVLLMEHSLRNMQKNIPLLEDEVQTVNEAKAKLEQYIAMLEQDAIGRIVSDTAYVQKVEMLQAEIEEKEIQLAASRIDAIKRSAVVDGSHSTTTNESQQARAEIVFLKAKVEQLVNASAQFDLFAERYNSDNSSLAKSMKIMQSELALSSHNCASLAVTLSESKASKLHLEGTLMVLSQEVEKYHHLLSLAEAETAKCAASYSTQIASLLAQVGEQRSKLVAQSHFIESLHGNTKELDMRYEVLVKDFEADLDTMEKEMNSANDANAVLEGKNSALESQLTSFKAESESTAARMKDLETSVKKFEGILREQNESESTSESKYQAAITKMRNLEITVKECEATIKERDEKESALSDRIQSIQIDLNTAQECRANVEVAHQDLKEEHRKTEALLTRLQQQYQAAIAKMRDLEITVKEYEATIKERDEKESALSDKIQSIQVDLNTAQECRANVEVAYQDLKEEHRKIEALLTRLQQQRKLEMHEFGQMVQKLESTTKVLARYENEQREFYTASEECELEMQELREKGTYLAKRIRDLEAKCLQQEDEIVDVRMMLLTQEAQYKLSCTCQSKDTYIPTMRMRRTNGTSTGDTTDDKALKLEYEVERHAPSHRPLDHERSVSLEIIELDEKGDTNESTECTWGANMGSLEPIAEDSQAQARAVGARMVCSIIEKRDSVALRTSFQQWATSANAMKAISQQAQVAHLMADQLESTREKLARLKAHLRISQKRS